MTTIALLLICITCINFISAKPAPHASYRLKYVPGISKTPVKSTFIKQSTNNAGKLYALSSSNYSAPVQLLTLTGTPNEIGHAYGELLAAEINSTYNAWYPTSNPQLELTLDWLWNCSLRTNTPQSLLDEINGVQPQSLRTKLIRVMTGSTLPMDSNNINIVIENAIKKHGNISEHCQQTKKDLLNKMIETPAKNKSYGLTHHCDFFAAWGSKTSDGRLLSTRNLDIKPATGISKHKLITIYNTTTDKNTYATVGFAGYFGALAGMSNKGITVSEANLDNGEVSFDGIAWPMRLREILSTAQSLNDARDIWHSKSNTAAFNFLIASGSEQKAVALETNALFTSDFFGNSSIERNATYSCHNGTIMDGHSCSWPQNDGTPVSIGAPLMDAVFRSNHGLSPDIMQTQEPLWNDTVMRYLLLSDRIEEVEGKMDVEEAIGIISLLGIKGNDYGSCEPSNFLTGDPTHVLSVLYDPTMENMYVAYEEGNMTSGTNANWRPAACNEYLWLNMSEWW